MVNFLDPRRNLWIVWTCPGGAVAEFPSPQLGLPMAVMPVMGLLRF